MTWLKRMIRSPVLRQVLVAALQLAAQLLRQEGGKMHGKEK
jgi:hypothetical protein